MKKFFASLAVVLLFASISVADKSPGKADGLAPEAAAKAMEMPPGFAVKLCAGEPDIKQPVAFCLDDRGRLWVAECYSYPNWKPEGNDRILIFEDTDGDGKFDKRTVFYDKLNWVTGLQVGFGGVWVGAPPALLFIPFKDGDDKPSGPPQVMLDGWAHEDTHETLNTFSWGPDGWLYGCHGVFTHSNVGKPGVPDSERQKINAGIWRYHPTKKIFEVFGEGTSNPWGFDFNDCGQAFCTACVIPHLYHIIQGGRYTRQAGEHIPPNTYDDIKTIADHSHSNDTDGGNAHSGAMFYLADSWPAQYRDQLVMNNIHGDRVLIDIMERKGSGYVGKHGPHFIEPHDASSQILNFLYDQNGSVFMIDWYDAVECHQQSSQTDRSNGRIFKIVYNNQKWTPVNLAKLSDAELVKLQLSPNDWYVRHARRLLQERGSNPKVHAALAKMLSGNYTTPQKLRALWALHCTGGLTEAIAQQQLQSSDEYLRAWTIQLTCEDKKPSPALLAKFAALAKSDPSPVVRLYLASALQRLPVDQRWPIATALVAHAEDAVDHNLPQLIWYGIEPAVGADADKALTLSETCKIPKVREFITRRIASSVK